MSRGVDGRRTMRRVVALALLAMAGIIGMLLVENAWDWLFLAMAALPLGVGAWCWRAQRRAKDATALRRSA